MGNYELTEDADADLGDILRHTYATWGQNQFEKYYALLETSFADLCASPDGARTRSEDGIFPGCRSIGVGQHRVFYEVLPDRILILRILHAGMDFGRHVF